jgi:lipid A 4'-phosphatase
MNWRRELIQLSRLLTILWAFISLYLALGDFRAAVTPLIQCEVNWVEPARQLHWFYFVRAFFWWFVGAAIWWGLLYAGFAVGRGSGNRPKPRFVLQEDKPPLSRLKLIGSAVIVGIMAAVIFNNWPETDIAVSGLFNMVPKVFVLDPAIAPVALGIQVFFTILVWLAGIGAVLGIIIVIATKRCLLGLGLAPWLFLALVLIIGPGILVNTVLKEHSGRPRPGHLIEFGGSHAFMPVFRSGECARNCSFVSGEASSIYAIGFAIAMLARRRRASLLGTAILAGSVVGFIRIAQGGHFLSDIIFAGVFMAIVVAIIHWFLFDGLPRLVPKVARTIALPRPG